MERQLLFLLDYDLRMEESELLTHFAPFLRRPTASGSSHRTRASIDESKMDLSSPHYPTTPRRSSHVTALLTPSPSPLPSRVRAPTSSSQRVSPVESCSSNDSGLTEDHGSDSSAENGEDMELDHAGRGRRPSSVAQYSIKGSNKTYSAPITPTDELSSYSLNPLPTAEPPLRTQRSGSFLRMYEVGKGMLNLGSNGLGSKASKGNLREGISSVDLVL